MISQESIDMMAASYAAMNDREDWSRILTTYRRSFEHRWVNERIVHPLPIEESRSRRLILNQAYRFMGWHYHMVVLEGDLDQCSACRYDYSGHASWRDPFT